MTRFVVGKAAQALAVLLLAYTITFVLLFAVPQDVVDLIFDPLQTTTESDAEREKLRAYLGLDEPMIVQFVVRLGSVVRGDFGTSVLTGKPVLDSVLQVLPSTLVLAGSALALALVLAFVIAITAAVTKREWISSALRSFPPAAVSVPAFLIGLLLLQVFSYQLHWFPSIGDHGLASLVLPTVALAIAVAGPIAQLLATNFATELEKPYATTATAKGMGRLAVVNREVLKNACLPALTIAGITLGNLLAGAIIIETIFARPGVGRLAETAVRTQDIALVQGVVLLAAFVFVLVNFVVDTTYPLLDPRQRHEVLRQARPAVVPGGSA